MTADMEKVGAVDAPPAAPQAIRAIPVRHYGRYVAALVAVALLVAIVYAFAQGKINWSAIPDYFFDHRIIHGVGQTLLLTVLSMAIGIVLGAVMAIMRLSPNPVVSGFSWLYIWFFRGTPLLVQLLFWQFGAALFKHISLGVPFGGPALIHPSYNSVVTAFVAALLGFGLNEGAYMAEIVRAGIISVDEGQTEAAQSLGMSRLQTLRLIILPQAMRVIIPPTGNETISMLKNTSLVYVLGTVADLLFAAQGIINTTYLPIPLLIVASIWYIAMTSVLYVGQFFIERHFGRGFSRAEQATMRSRWLGMGRGGSGAAGGAVG
jgi:polar amino acid transport system permease protein